MAVWYRYVCLDCGYSGLTRDGAGYERGRHVCPRCSGLRFEVEGWDAASLPEEDDLGPAVEELNPE